MQMASFYLMVEPVLRINCLMEKLLCFNVRRERQIHYQQHRSSFLNIQLNYKPLTLYFFMVVVVMPPSPLALGLNYN